jgi:2-polyprenyl-3-methyl-5-hydroxy-6-metoxy-1,4-benzoquinol methylase
MNPNLKVKPDVNYYSRAREWPANFDLRHGATFLDIGCGCGVMGKFLQDTYGAKVTGLEIIPENAETARGVLHECLVGDIEQMDVSALAGKFDYIVFSDSLEHLLEPQATLEKVRPLLNAGGSLLISIPNIRNFRASLPLLLGDDWEYTDEGLLDRTHLRFFTQTSITNLLHRTGYRVDHLFVDLPRGTKVGLLNRLTGGVFKRLLTSHYFIQASPCES